MTKEKTILKDLANEFDHTTGSINLATETIEDISTNLLQVVEEMDNVPEGTDLRIHFIQWHRDLRILAKLMHHASNDLVEGNEEARDLSEKLFEEVVRKPSN